MRPRALLVGMVVLWVASAPLRADDLFIRGDANQSGEVSIGDAAVVTTWLFAGGTKPSCLDACDANNDERNDISDVISLLRFSTLGDQLPSMPFPEPGVDPAGDGLDCGFYSPTPISETSDARVEVTSVEAEAGSEAVVQVSLTTSRPVLAVSVCLEVSSPFVDPPGVPALELTGTRLSNGLSTALGTTPSFAMFNTTEISDPPDTTYIVSLGLLTDMFGSVWIQPGTIPLFAIDLRTQEGIPAASYAIRLVDTQETRNRIVFWQPGAEAEEAIPDLRDGTLTVVPPITDWSEDFDSYAAGSLINGQGGWVGWGGDVIADGVVSTAEAFSGPNSLQTQISTDMVRGFNFTSGAWTLRAKVLIPADHTGSTWLILLNTYEPLPETYNWSAQVAFGGGYVKSHGGTNFFSRAGTGMPLVPDTWGDLRIDIDLAANTQRVYYNGTLLHATVWQHDGAARIHALDLWSDGGSPAYFDDVTLEPMAAPESDCNYNGIDDATDIACGTSGDCNNDGVPDECLTIGPFKFLAGQSLTTSAVVDIAAEDLDADGDVDLAVTDPSTFVWVLRNAGNGTFQDDPQSYRVGQAPKAVVAVDVNNDGARDLITANALGKSVSVLINAGDASFGEQTPIGLSDAVRGVAAADLDGDGDVDLAAVGGTGKVWLLENAGGGDFALVDVLTTGATPNCVVTADLDGDGDFDLVTGNGSSQDGVSVLVNNGNWDFAPAQHLNVLERVLKLTLADVDGDGRPDIAGTCSGIEQDKSSSTVFVLANRGDGTFSPATTYPVGSVVQAIATAEIDRDGHVDLVVAGGTNNVWVLPNSGRGGFLPAYGLQVEGGPTALAASDLSGDGKPDLAVLNLSGGGLLSVLLNRTSRTHLDWTDNGIVDSCETGGFVRGDANSSGAVDIADAISILSYLFGTADDPSKAKVAECLDAADANDDGMIDIADAIKILGHLFAQAGPLAEPFGSCGFDPTNDGVNCMSFPACDGR